MGWAGGDQPDPAQGYVSGIKTDLATLPARRMIEALAQTGEAGYVDIPKASGKIERQYFDFRGLGEADVQRAYADKLTGELLSIQQEFGPQYVEQRLRELEAADPQGAAMRRQLWNSIQESSSTVTERPNAEALEKLIMEQIDRAGQLDPEVEREISQSVLGGQVERGNYLGNAAATQEASVLASASEAQRATAQERALQFLTSGVSPDDAAYREQMQDVNNLGAFLSGETPTAQFGQLSGAAGGAVPFNTGPGVTGVNPNAGRQGVQNYMTNFNTTAAAANNTVNPWVAGLAGAFNGWNLAASFGSWGDGSGGGAKPAGSATPAGVQGGWNFGFGQNYAGAV